MGIYINKGNDGFRSARNSEYIDKSGLIAIVISTLNTEQRFSCVTRSRRPTIMHAMTTTSIANTPRVRAMPTWCSYQERISIRRPWSSNLNMTKTQRPPSARSRIGNIPGKLPTTLATYYLSELTMTKIPSSINAR